MQGPFDAAFFNSVFGNVFEEALLRACLLLKPGDRPLPCALLCTDSEQLLQE